MKQFRLTVAIALITVVNSQIGLESPRPYHSNYRDSLDDTVPMSNQKHQMNGNRYFRAVLVVGAGFNFFMALVILFPNTIGRFADLPRSESRFFSWLLALFVALFGGVYAYLSRTPVIERSLITLAVIGKTGVFLVALACLLLGDLSPRAFAPAIGDLIFAVIFLGWLRSTAFK